MDNNIILGIVITIIVIVPVLILATAGSRKQKKAIAKFKNYASSHSMNLGQCDCCEKLIIGVDDNARKIIYKQGNEDFKIVDLNEVKNCNLRTSSEVINGDLIDKLEMDLVLKDGKGTQSMTFFTSENKLTIENEKQIIEQWKKKIDSLL